MLNDYAYLVIGRKRVWQMVSLLFVSWQSNGIISTFHGHYTCSKQPITAVFSASGGQRGNTSSPPNLLLVSRGIFFINSRGGIKPPLFMAHTSIGLFNITLYLQCSLISKILHSPLALPLHK